MNRLLPKEPTKHVTYASSLQHQQQPHRTLKIIFAPSSTCNFRHPPPHAIPQSPPDNKPSSSQLRYNFSTLPRHRQLLAFIAQPASSRIEIGVCRETRPNGCDSIALHVAAQLEVNWMTSAWLLVLGAAAILVFWSGVKCSVDLCQDVATCRYT